MVTNEDTRRRADARGVAGHGSTGGSGTAATRCTVMVRPTDANRDWAGIDIFGFDADGKIVEHWDALQVVPARATHENTLC